MSALKPRSSLGAELRAVTEETGAAVLRDGERTFVVVEVEPEPVAVPARPYRVVDSEEAAALMDALNDDDNPSYSTSEAIAHLKELRSKRNPRG